jgi:HEAT repeat protein
LASVPPERIAKQRIINMLTATEAELARAGASFVFAKYLQDPEMIELTKQQLMARYRSAAIDPEVAEAAAWFCKVLGETGNKEFIPLLQEVEKNSNQPAVERWASKSISKLKYGKAGPNRSAGQEHFR